MFGVFGSLGALGHGTLFGPGRLRFAPQGLHFGNLGLVRCSGRLRFAPQGLHFARQGLHFGNLGPFGTSNYPGTLFRPPSFRSTGTAEGPKALSDAPLTSHIAKKQ